MEVSPLAGQLPPANLLIDVSKLIAHFYQRWPNMADPQQRVSFGTSGHRGTSEDGSLTAAHIRAITQAICEYRKQQGISGPLFMGKDTHALSGPAQDTALEVLAAHEVTTFIQRGDGFTPTPVISHAILSYNRGRTAGLADGIIITPSHNPPRDGGFKYNPPTGGPADVQVTTWIQNRANQLLDDANRQVQAIPLERALKASTTYQHDYITPYVAELNQVIDMECIRAAGLKLGVDPLGGAARHYWEPIAERYQLDITIVNPTIDPTFAFMPVDHDGQIRMDCSSPYAMAKLVALKNDYDVAFGNDPDSDRHGIVTRSAGLLNPNHYLAVAIRYLFTHRPGWRHDAAIGKTVVSSSLIDRVAASIGRRVVEVPVGFKWFVDGLYDGSLGFGGEESAGLSFLRLDGTVWTTDKDGPIADLLAAEITARSGHDPGRHYEQLEAQFGPTYYQRVDHAVSPENKQILKNLRPESVPATTLAGEPILAKLTQAPGNQAAIGGLKVVTESGWFAARPSGTEDVYKIYAESTSSEAHLDDLLSEAQQIVERSLSQDT